MTSFITKEDRLQPIRNALSKVMPHQTEQILLLFDLAAVNQFGSNEISQLIISEMGQERAAELSLDEFLARTEKEISKLPKSPKQWKDVLDKELSKL